MTLLVDQFRRSLNECQPPRQFDASRPNDNTSLDYAIWSFLHSWAQNTEIGPDEAVLFRQIARWQTGHLHVGRIPEDLAGYAGRAGFHVDPSGSLSASPFVPEWLVGNAVPENEGIDVRPILRRPGEEVPAEPYLRLLHYPSWQSQAQKEATWMMLNAGPGSTSLVALPTGSGKSLCFQTVARFSTGVTIVVVPTVALAIDQWRSAREVLDQIPDIKPHYFASGDPDLDPEQVASDLRTGACRLVFTSPESLVSGRLRSVVEELIRTNRFDNLIIDEAHIIETWGINFRVEFQLLSSLLRKWRRDSANRLRTYLLSATFTRDTKAVLQSLFFESGEWNEFVSQRLRPEISYYRQKFSNESDREGALIDCLWHLPRPAIVYTTEVKESERLFRKLRSIGFRRVGCFNGETRASERRRQLLDWRSNNIDLMIATSAFGLGVDKADVRSVIHACFPENTHRYYQEVGRGGRDGNSAIAVLLPTQKDIRVAQNMAPTLLGEENAQSRWEAMWSGKRGVEGEPYTFLFNPTIRRQGLLGTRTYGENTRWNKRLLLQLLRAGKIEILDLQSSQGESDDQSPVELIKVKMCFSGDSGTVGRDLADLRKKELALANDGLSQMLDYLDGGVSICRLLKRIYGPNVQLACGGCPGCRLRGFPPTRCEPLSFDTFESDGRAFALISDLPDPSGSANRIKWREIVRSMVREKSILRFVAADSNTFIVLRDIFESAFDEKALDLYRLDQFVGLESSIFRSECAAVFHIGRVNSTLLKMRTGNSVAHFVSYGTPITDVSGRRIGEADGWSYFPGFEIWRANTNRCSQMDQ